MKVVHFPAWNLDSSSHGSRVQIVQAIGLAENDSDVGCIVLAGNGKAFCGGGDLTGNARRETEAEGAARRAIVAYALCCPV